MAWDISTLESPEPETFANFFFLSSNLSEFGKYKRPLSPALIPISWARETLLSWKNDAVDSVSRLEDENEEKLVDGTCNWYGATEVAGRDSPTLSLMFKKPSPSGQPIGMSSF